MTIYNSNCISLFINKSKKKKKSRSKEEAERIAAEATEQGEIINTIIIYLDNNIDMYSMGTS